MNYTSLQSELVDDPLGRGYAGMTDSEVADSLNTADRSIERGVLSGSAIFNSIVPSEFQSLDAAEQALVRDVWDLGDTIDVGTGTNARTVLLNAFGPGTTTRTNLASVVQATISRATELGLPTVSTYHVTRARSL